MSNTNTGGPAFPTEVWDSEGVPQHTEGMTLRDYFAAKAMQAALMTAVPGASQGIEDVVREASKAAYLAADAMLKARDA